MRPSCPDCVRKHLAQASIISSEVKLGHPELYWFAVGHLAEAEAESVKDYPELAEKIRQERLTYIANPAHNIDAIALIKAMTTIYNESVIKSRRKTRA
jgi:hypothetical protein